MKLYVNDGKRRAVFSCANQEEAVAKFILKYQLPSSTELLITVSELGFRDYDPDDKQSELLKINVS